MSRARAIADSLPRVGEYIHIQTDLTGASPPPRGTGWIRLEAGLTGVGEYNEGLLDNESVTGSAPLVEATAEIVDSESPLNGQVVHLLETERRVLRAGSVGTVENDQMQRITGEFTSQGRSQGSQDAIGAFDGSAPIANNWAAGSGASTSNSQAYFFNSTNSPDARASTTTDGETRAKNIGVAVYMRIR